MHDENQRWGRLHLPKPTPTLIGFVMALTLLLVWMAWTGHLFD